MNVWSVFLFGSFDLETWDNGKKKGRKVFESWCFRRMLKLFWIDRVGNEEVLLQ